MKDERLYLGHIREAVKQLSDETRRQQPAIPWRQVAGMHNHLSHAYFGVDPRLAWRVIERDLGPLDAAVETLLRR